MRKTLWIAHLRDEVNAYWTEVDALESARNMGPGYGAEVDAYPVCISDDDDRDPKTLYSDLLAEAHPCLMEPAEHYEIMNPEDWHINMDSFGSMCPANWEEIADALNEKIDALVAADPSEMRSLTDQLWEDYCAGKLDDVPAAHNALEVYSVNVIGNLLDASERHEYYGDGEPNIDEYMQDYGIDDENIRPGVPDGLTLAEPNLEIDPDSIRTVYDGNEPSEIWFLARTTC